MVLGQSFNLMRLAHSKRAADVNVRFAQFIGERHAQFYCKLDINCPIHCIEIELCTVATFRNSIPFPIVCVYFATHFMIAHALKIARIEIEIASSYIENCHVNHQSIILDTIFCLFCFFVCRVVASSKSQTISDFSSRRRSQINFDF